MLPVLRAFLHDIGNNHVLDWVASALRDSRAMDGLWSRYFHGHRDTDLWVIAGAKKEFD
jgi:hypothetical protein